MSHTPGPWEFFGAVHDEDGEPGFFSITNGIIEVANTASGDVPTHTEEANARLIAAAPDLLAALESLLAVCVEELDDKRTPEMRQARNAIAKAKRQA